MVRHLVVMLFILALVAPTGAALARPGGAGVVTAQQEEQAPPTTAAGRETTTTGDAPAPAVPAEEEPEAEETPAWTYRFLVPTALLLGVLTVLGIIIGYFVKVTRSRYRVVE